MRILVVEDRHRHVADVLRPAERGGLRRGRAATGEEAVASAAENEYDAIVLDLVLPMSTASRCVAAPRADRWSPILILTARDAVEDRVAGSTPAPTTT